MEAFADAWKHARDAAWRAHPSCPPLAVITLHRTSRHPPPRASALGRRTGRTAPKVQRAPKEPTRDLTSRGQGALLRAGRAQRARSAVACRLDGLCRSISRRAVCRQAGVPLEAISLQHEYQVRRRGSSGAPKEPQRSPKGAPPHIYLAHVAGARGWRTWLARVAGARG